MRILQVMAGGAHGGAERFFEDLAGGFARAGLDQAFAIRGYADRVKTLQNLSSDLETFSFSGPLDFVTPWKLRRFARNWKPHVVLGWMNRASRSLPRGPWATVGRLGGYYDLKYYQRCDHVICNTPDIRDYVVREGWPSDRAHFIPNFCTATTESGVDRQALNTPVDAKVILVLARLHDSKGVDIAIQALTNVPNAILWIAGAGPLESELKRLAGQISVSDRVRFLGWREDRSSLLRSADVCVVPSRMEPFGNVVLNAWEHDVPLVATTSQGPKYLVHDGDDGLLVPIDEPTFMAKAINRILEDADLARALAAKGKRRVSEEFSEIEIVAQYQDLFAKILNQDGAG